MIASMKKSASMRKRADQKNPVRRMGVAGTKQPTRSTGTKHRHEAPERSAEVHREKHPDWKNNILGIKGGAHQGRCPHTCQGFPHMRRPRARRAPERSHGFRFGAVGLRERLDPTRREAGVAGRSPGRGAGNGAKRRCRASIGGRSGRGIAGVPVWVVGTRFSMLFLVLVPPMTGRRRAIPGWRRAIPGRGRGRWIVRR